MPTLSLSTIGARMVTKIAAVWESAVAWPSPVWAMARNQKVMLAWPATMRITSRSQRLIRSIARPRTRKAVTASGGTLNRKRTERITRTATSIWAMPSMFCGAAAGEVAIGILLFGPQ